MPSLLLHSCCAPCSILPLEALQKDNWDITVLYYNPNIHPQSEYLKRLDTLKVYAEKISVKVLEGIYQPELWEREVGSLGGPYPLIAETAQCEHNSKLKKRRCSACYELRFKELAKVASEQDFQAISTTLSISPYQYVDEMSRILSKQATIKQLDAVFEDFKAYYPEATKRSRELGMYRQNYCGCHFSEQEAQLEREARKAQRQREKAKHADI